MAADANSLFGDALFKKLEDERKAGKVLIANVAPAVRVAFGEMFGFPPGQNTLGRVIATLRQMGFAHVVDTSLGADIATYYEAQELKRMLESNEARFPVFNSCCIGWRIYAGKAKPEIVKNITIIASPQMTIGAVSRFYIAQKLGIDPGKIVTVGVMPCTLKKNETAERMKNGYRYVDYVITTVELAQQAKKLGFDMSKMEEEEFSELMRRSSREGVIFGVTGGMTEAVLSTLSYLLGEKKEVLEFRDDGEIKSRSVKIGKYTLNVAVVFGFNNFEKLYREIKAGKQYHLVEVMMCPFGCVGGPGQPPQALDKIRMRGQALRAVADGMAERNPIDSTEVRKIREKFLEKMERKKLEELIYFNR